MNPTFNDVIDEVWNKAREIDSTSDNLSDGSVDDWKEAALYTVAFDLSRVASKKALKKYYDGIAELVSENKVLLNQSTGSRKKRQYRGTMEGYEIALQIIGKKLNEGALSGCRTSVPRKSGVRVNVRKMF